MKFNCNIAKQLFTCLGMILISSFTTNIANACIGGTCVQGPDGVMICPTSVSLTCGGPQIEKMLDYSSFEKDINFVSVMNNNLKLEDSIRQDKINYSKHNSLNNPEYKYSMIKYYKSDLNIQPKDSFIKADKITVNNDNDIIISGS